MNKRPSRFMLIARMFGVIYVVCLLMSLFWNTLSGRNIFRLGVVFWVSVVLTIIFISVGWTVVTGGSNVLLKNDAEFQRWKAQGGRPYWDSLPKPINPNSPDDMGKG